MSTIIATGLGLHSLLPVCIGSNLCKPPETYVHVGFSAKRSGDGVGAKGSGSAVSGVRRYT